MPLNKLKLQKGMQERNEEGEFQLYFDINGIRILKGVIDYAIEMWPGAPKRPYEEQEFLWVMRDTLNKCVMEHSFQNLSMDDK